MSGQPLGSAMFLWTATLSGIEAMNSRLLWRDYWQDWLIASIWHSLCLPGGFYFARLSSGGGSVFIVLPQFPWSILLFPAIVRSAEHTSELQSLMRDSYADFCLKKKKMKYYNS